MINQRAFLCFVLLYTTSKSLCSSTRVQKMSREGLAHASVVLEWNGTRPGHTVEGENSLVHISLKSQSSKTSRLYQAEISRVKGALAQADGILKNKSLKSRCLLPIFRELKSSCIPCLLAFSFSVNRCTCRRKKGQLYRYRCGLQKRHETDT